MEHMCEVWSTCFIKSCSPQTPLGGETFVDCHYCY